MTHYIAMFFVVVPFFWKRNGKHPDRRSKHLLNPSYCFSQFTATFCYVWFGLTTGPLGKQQETARSIS